MSATLFQPEPSANAPCTRTTFLYVVSRLFSFAVEIQTDQLIPGVPRLRAKPLLSGARDMHFTYDVKTYWLLVGVRGGGGLFDELGRFLRVRHVGHMAGIHFDRPGLGALRHHALLVRIDRPVCGGHHVPSRLGLPSGLRDLMGERVGGDRHLRYGHIWGAG